MIDTRIDNVDHSLTVNHGLRSFRGGSGETKPTENISAGSTFWEWDTCKGFMFDGEEWLLQTSGGGGGGEVYAIGIQQFMDGDNRYLLTSDDYRVGSKLTETNDGEGTYYEIADEDRVFTVSKGDSIYLYSFSSLSAGDEVFVDFRSYESGNVQYLIELLDSDFTTDDAGAAFCNITIPEKDTDNNEWGGNGFLCVQFSTQ